VSDEKRIVIMVTQEDIDNDFGWRVKLMHAMDKASGVKVYECVEVPCKEGE
jgi:hypothetical protein